VSMSMQMTRKHGVFLVGVAVWGAKVLRRS
jgi:hypothetical protein